MLVYQLALTCYIAKHGKSVIKFYKDGPKTKELKMAFVMRMLILLPEFLGGLLGIFTFIDVAGAFLIFDYFTAREHFCLLEVQSLALPM